MFGQGQTTDSNDSATDVSIDASKADSTKKHVLLIEDEPLTRLVLLNELRMAGIEVYPAQSGRSALARLRHGYPDAIFLGLPLQDMDGIQLIKEIRRDTQYENRPIFVCDSEFPGRSRSRKAIEAGATKVFDKLATPMHVILAEVVADLRGKDRPVERRTSEVEAKSEASNNHSSDLHESVSGLNRSLQLLAECRDREARAVECRKLHDLAYALQREVEAAGRRSVGRHVSVLEWFLKELCDKPNEINDSSLQTVSLAIDVLGLIADSHEQTEFTEFVAVVVDNDPNSGTAICSALANAGFSSSAFVDPAEAMSHLGSHRVDLVVLDVGLASQNGSDLYTRIHEIPFNHDTSVILVTKPTSPDGFLQVLSSCDTQFLVKPQSATNYSEIALKGSSRALKNRVGNRSVAPQQASRAKELDPSIPSLDPSVLAAFEGVPFEAPGKESNTVLRKNNVALQQQLDAVSAEAAKQRDALHKKEEERNNLAERVFSSELELNRTRGFLGEEHERRRQLEQELQHLATTKGQQQSEEHSRIESSLQAELNAAKETVEQAEAALKEEVGRNKKSEERLRALRDGLKQEQIERSRRFDEEVLRLQRKHEELQSQMAAEQQGAAQSKQRCEELQKQIQENATELERVKASLKDREQDKVRLESELQTQLNATKAAADQAEAALKQKAAQCSKLEEELATLRLEHRELQAILAAEHEKSEESRQKADDLDRRLRENTTELERVKAELKKAGHSKHVEQELANLRRQHEEIHAELKAELRTTAEARKVREELENRLRGKSAELERVQGDHHRHVEEKAHLESEVRTRARTVNVVAGQIETVREEQATHLVELRDKLTHLERLQDELSSSIAAGQRMSVDSGGRSEELGNQLRQTAAELQQAQADRDKQAEQQKHVESGLSTQIQAANEATRQAEADLREETAGKAGFKDRLRRLGDSLKPQRPEDSKRSEELDGLRLACEELRSKLATEQEMAAEIRRGRQELESRLCQRTEEFERVKRELDQQAAERTRLESELGEQRSAVRTAAEKAEAAHREGDERSKRLENELSTLRLGREELSGKLESAQRNIAESNGRANELESQLAGLRRKYEELSGKLNAEERVVTETGRSKQELEARLNERNQEFERIKGELAQQATDRARLESELSEQRSAAKAALEKAEAGRVEAVERKQLEDEVTSLRQASEELNGKLQTTQEAKVASNRRVKELQSQVAELWLVCDELHVKLAAQRDAMAETRRGKQELEAQLGERTEAFEKIKAELEQHAAERARSELVSHEDTERTNWLESELASLRLACEELNGKLAVEQGRLGERSEEFERVRRELDQQAGERARLESALSEARQLAEESKESVAGLETRLANTADELRSARGELEQRALERNFLESHHKSVAETNAALKAELDQLQEHQGSHERELSALEHQLSESTASLARATADLETERGERGRVEERASTLTIQSQELRAKLAEHLQVDNVNQTKVADLERQLRSRDEAIARITANFETERTDRCRLQERASSLAVQLQDLHIDLSRHLQIEKDNQKRVADLEKQLREREEAFVGLTASLETERTERRHVEERASILAVQLQELHTELTKHLQVEKDSQERFANVEQELRQREEGFARLTVTFEAERAERCRVEERASALSVDLQELHTELNRQQQVEKDNRSRVADAERQLREHEEALAVARADREKAIADRQLADDQLQAAGNVIGELRQYAVAFEETKKAFTRTEEELESRWQTTSNVLREREAKLQREASERQRLAEVLEAMQHTLQMQSQSSAIELAKLRSALDVESLERRRLEGEASHSRYALLNSARAARTMINALRSKNQELVAESIQATRRLLELGLNGEQKKLAESILQTGLTLLASARQSGVPEFSSIANEPESQLELIELPFQPPSDEEPPQRACA